MGIKHTLELIGSQAHGHPMKNIFIKNADRNRRRSQAHGHPMKNIFIKKADRK
jgi:hypothetical protein